MLRNRVDKTAELVVINSRSSPGASATAAGGGDRALEPVVSEATMPRVAALFALVVALLPLNAQQTQRSAPDLLNHALYLAELYNWADAGPEFSQAEKMFVAAGDQRNALCARLGRLRSSVEQGTLPAISTQLATELETNPLLLNDRQLRMFCLIVKGDVDSELNSNAMRHDWEQVQALAHALGNTSESRLALRVLAGAGLVRASRCPRLELGQHRTASDRSVRPSAARRSQTDNSGPIHNGFVRP